MAQIEFCNCNQKGNYSLGIVTLDSGELACKNCRGVIPLSDISEGDSQLQPPEPKQRIAKEYLADVMKADVDTLVLGCTHYPLLTGVISYVMGNNVSLVSSAEETAKDLYRILVESDSLRTDNSTPATHRFLATGDAAAFETLARRFLGPEVGQVEHQSLT